MSGKLAVFTLFAAVLLLVANVACLTKAARQHHVKISTGTGKAHMMKTSITSTTKNHKAASSSSSDPSYDHQTTTYTANHKPVTVSGSDINVIPFFSPDHSIHTLAQMITEAKHSIDIGCPGFESWSGCTPYNSQCAGCTAAFLQSNESFPIWRALVNAIHRGVKVRILTNDYNESDCEGKISPLSYLQLAGAEIRFYTTTTFMHAKYMNIDNKNTSVSSINYSYTSFLKNREAGMIIYGTDAQPAISYMQSIYEMDFEQGLPYQINQTYPDSWMSIINDPTPLDLMIPPTLTFSSCKVESPTPAPISDIDSLVAIANPDYAQSQYLSYLKNVQESLYLSIYQINDPTLCNELESMYRAGIDVKIFVSNVIYSEPDWETSQTCYSQLYNAGLVVKKSCRHCLTYSHQKFWIMDGESVMISTGNWSPTDVPDGSSDLYPPYGSSGWRQTNRDYTLAVTSKDVVRVFETVFFLDYNQGFDYYPYDSKN